MDDKLSTQLGSTSGSLVYASYRGDIDTVARLLESGIDPDATSELVLDGVSTVTVPLMAAAAFGGPIGMPSPMRRNVSNNIIRKLLDAGASTSAIEVPLLESLIISGNCDAIELIVHRGARLRQPYHLLSLAITHHQLEVLPVLARYGLGPNTTDGHGNTVLHHICSGALPYFRDNQWHEITDPDSWFLSRIKQLRHAGIDLDRRDGIGTTALMRAIVARQFSLARALIVAGADINCRMRNGVAALHLALVRANQGLVGLLLDRNIDRQDVLRISMKRIQPDMRALISTRVRTGDSGRPRHPPTTSYQGLERRLQSPESVPGN